VYWCAGYLVAGAARQAPVLRMIAIGAIAMGGGSANYGAGSVCLFVCQQHLLEGQGVVVVMFRVGGSGIGGDFGGGTCAGAEIDDDHVVVEQVVLWVL
jgi:hypothetical protein